jgi:hypothetical protein
MRDAVLFDRVLAVEPNREDAVGELGRRMNHDD